MDIITYAEEVLRPRSVQATCNLAALQARQECIDRVERALRGLFPRTGHRASLVLVGSYAIGTDDIDSDVDMVACLHVSQKEVFHNHFPQVLKSAAFSVKPILTARAPVYRITDVSRNLILELQYAIFKGEIPDIEDMLKQDYKADLDVDAGKISGIEAIVHTLRLQSIIRNLPRPQQTLFMQGTLMLKSYLGNYGLTGASYGHMPSAAIAALTAYALANKDIQTSGGLNSFFPALLRWVADLLTQDAHEGWGEVLSLPGRTVKDEEVTNYKRASGTPQPVFVAALSMPLRNLTATVHQYHQTHTAEMLRSDALKMLEGRDMREVMAGFGEPYLDSYTAMTNYTHFVVTIVGSKKQDLSAQEQETVNELIGLKFLPIAQRLHTSSEVMGYHLLPKPVFIMQDPDSDELSVAPADDRKAYRGYLQAVRVRDLEADGRQQMDTIPNVLKEAYTSVRGAVIATLRKGGPSQDLPKHKAEEVYFETYLLNTRDGGGHEFSQATRLDRVDPPKASGKRKAWRDGGAGSGERAAGGEEQGSADTTRLDDEAQENKRAKGGAQRGGGYAGLSLDEEEKKKADKRQRRQRWKDNRRLAREGGGGGGGGGMTEAKVQEEEEAEGTGDEEMLVDEVVEGGMKGEAAGSEDK